ncbi:MAG: GDSL-type esterase/lipase family protein [Puniceicoccales bacterium]|jgi:N-acetylglucosamine-6-sulfatase|nr:GDSL-type esterase/lipase family protein [Puniceicoccales bacterium]
MQIKRRSFLSLLPVAIATAFLPSGYVNAAPEPTKNSGRHEQFNAEAQKGGYDVLFLGDSLTEGWDLGSPHGGKEVWEKYIAPFKAARFGIGGEKSTHLLWRVQNGNLGGTADPKLIVILIGTNDNWPTRRNKPNAVRTASNIRALVGAIQKRKPNAKILLLGLLPAYKDPGAPWRKNNIKTNEIIKGYANNKDIFFFDFSKKLTTSDGKLRGHSGQGDDFYHKDEIHLRAPGYEAYAKAVAPEIKRILALKK